MTTAPHRPLRVLVVDDNEDSTEMLADLISTMNCEVSVANAGVAAVQAMVDAPSDVVFLDLGLPDIDGYEVARRIRARVGAGCRIVALTGFSDAARRTAAHEAGCDTFLVKPVRFADLKRVLAAPQACV